VPRIISLSNLLIVSVPGGGLFQRRVVRAEFYVYVFICSHLYNICHHTVKMNPTNIFSAH